MLSADGLEARDIVLLYRFCYCVCNLNVAESYAVAELVYELHLFLVYELVGEHNVYYVPEHGIAHSWVDFQNVPYGVVEYLPYIACGCLFEELAREYLQSGKHFDNVVELVFVYLLVASGYKQSCRCNEFCHVLVELAVAHLQQDGY